MRITDRTLTEKQYAAIARMLKTIGYTDEKVIAEYIRYLRAFYGRNIQINEVNGIKIFGYSESECVSALIDEIELKKARRVSLINNSITKITATDLAQFTFCPISFSIKRSFKVDASVLTEIGIHCHERGMLAKKEKQDSRLERISQTRNFDDNYGVYKDEVVLKIIRSKKKHYRKGYDDTCME